MAGLRCSALTFFATLLVAAAGCGDDPATEIDANSDTVCNDGVDNDGDQSTDYPADPGCSSALDTTEENSPVAMCSDERDNDGDGRTDYPDDPGCFSPLQDSEDDDCPDGENCPACSNGTDDDEDGLTDYPADAGCVTASDTSEFQVNTTACGSGLVVQLLEPLQVTGTIPGSPSHLTSVSCGGAGGEQPFAIVIEEPAVLVATTDLAQTNVDTVLYLRSSCTDESTELACNDNSGPGVNKSRLVANVAPGVYYLIVDGRDLAGGGNFALSVELFRGEGESCSVQGECGEGLQCWDPTGGTNTLCSLPQCGDDIDTDGDGINGYPDEPGCQTATDFDEVDDCPDGPNCPACSNDVDDDADGATDYPDDIDCESAAHPVEGCTIEQDPISVLTTGTATGSTTDLTDDFYGSCDWSGGGGPDAVYLVNLPHMQTFEAAVNGSGFYPVLILTDQTCDNQLECSFPYSNYVTFDRDDVAAGNYAVVVDGYGSGSYTLTVSGVIAPGGDCTGDLATAGAIACDDGYVCSGGVCLGSQQCNNGVDDDGDGKAGYPEDPGCSSPLDDDESDDCPSGPNCPECGNAIDDDGADGTDWPADDDCNAASDDTELALSCGAEADEVLEVLTPSFTGTTTGLSNDYFASCGYYDGAPDAVRLITVPELEELHVDESMYYFDWIMMITGPECSAASELSCVDYGTAQANNLAAGTYAIIIDGWYTGSGDYELTVGGTIVSQGSCDTPLVSGGVLSCRAGQTCNGTQCVGTSQCSDGVDNDGDGLSGYPSDPGCVDPDDDSETDDCPSGPECPACSNDVDDDADGDTDYPQDTSCIAAGGGSEATCGFDTGGTTDVVIPLYAGTTAGGGDDFDLPCSSGLSAEDRAFALTLPVPVDRLVVDHDGSSFDDVIAVLNGSCTNVLACQDWDDAELTNLAAGSYGIVVDGWSGTGNYELYIRGTVAPGTACTDPLFSTGVLVCPANYICTAGTCQPL